MIETYRRNPEVPAGDDFLLIPCEIICVGVHAANLAGASCTCPVVNIRLCLYWRIPPYLRW
jgi:hypothetical protein